MSEKYSESNYENAVLEIFRASLGYNYIYGPNFERDYHKPFHEAALRDALPRLNAHLPRQAIAEALSKLENLEVVRCFKKTWFSWIICKTAFL